MCPAMAAVAAAAPAPRLEFAPASQSNIFNTKTTAHLLHLQRVGRCYHIWRLARQKENGEIRRTIKNVGIKKSKKYCRK